MAHCLYCDKPIQSKASWTQWFGRQKEVLLCAICTAKLEKLTEPLCSICGRSLQDLEKNFHNGTTCYDCERWENDSTYQNVLTKNRSLYKYNPFLKDIISQFKYRGDYALCEIFAQPLKNVKHKQFPNHIIVPIPLSEERLYERGFNQAEALAQLLGQPLPALQRHQHEEKQSKKNRSDRIKKKENPFVVSTSYVKELQNTTILLLDDIYTTGATLRFAAKALRDVGAKSVSSLTIARG